jgi:lipopolysaccharide/colanic/teichoic acid biosynthesis glycosyltransferase
MGTNSSKTTLHTDVEIAKVTVSRSSQFLAEQAARREQPPLAESVFQSMLTLERRRAERSRKPFVLMLLDAMHEDGSAAPLLSSALKVVESNSRETDVVGWYKNGVILGVIFTEVATDSKELVTETLRRKMLSGLEEEVGPEQSTKIAISFHVFPDHWDREQRDWTADQRLYPDLNHKTPRKRLTLTIKRVMDLGASALILLTISPILAAIAVIIKLTSKGPVIFRQERLGQSGARFNCLKFRTMYANNDPKIHQEYIAQFIAGKEGAAGQQDNGKKPVYKITNDPRVTPIGRLLRKTSLDELPQFWNVLRGEMSLVGPRPPVPYEFEIYDTWHRRRVLELKPGITGLWQVSGRSSTSFDDMVRLDLRYCRSWSLWLDIKILLATPTAIFTGQGAY